MESKRSWCQGKFVMIPQEVLLDPTLTPAAVMTFLALAKHANKDGTCFPSVRKLAKVSRNSPSTVRSHLAALEKRGFISRHSRFRSEGRGQTSSSYQLMPAAPTVRDERAIAGDTPPGSPAVGDALQPPVAQ